MNGAPVRSPRDLEEARFLQGKLRQLFDSAQPGSEEPDSLTEVRRLCDRAILTTDDEFCQQQLCEVERHAIKMFSESGVMFQRRVILDTLEAIGDRLVSLQTMQRSADALGRSEALILKP